MYDIILKEGLIVDPGQGLHEIGSVAVKDGRIAALGKNVSGTEAEQVFDMRGKILSPGLIDLHCHAAPAFTFLGVPPDEVGLNTGVTLLCDGGSSGPANFEALRRLVIEPAQTDMVCFLHIAKAGLIALPEIHTPHEIDIEACRQVAEANPDLVRGIKVRAIGTLAEGVGIQAVETAKKLAADLSLPLVVHIGDGRERVPGDTLDDFSRAAASLLEKGDVLCHYLTWETGGLVQKNGTIYPELFAARRRGVVLDACHGSVHFNFTIARVALAAGLFPDILSTDMAVMNLPFNQSLAVLMSKFLNLGLTLDQVIAMTTLNPAKVLGEEERRGSLRPGMPADITVTELLEGDYLFSDGKGRETLHGTRLLEPRMVFKGGRMRPAYSRYHIPPVFV